MAATGNRPLDGRFFAQGAEEVARALMGCWLESRIGGRITGGWIVETEAYLGFDDPASHAFRGRRYAGNRSIYAPPGTWYIYRSYGMHWCANLVTGPVGLGAAVLLRAIKPAVGVEIMRERRPTAANGRLADGPGKLAQALGVSGALDGVAMAGSDVLVCPGRGAPSFPIVTTPRVGITKGRDAMLRFVAG